MVDPVNKGSLYDTGNPLQEPSKWMLSDYFDSNYENTFTYIYILNCTRHSSAFTFFMLYSKGKCWYFWERTWSQIVRQIFPDIPHITYINICVYIIVVAFLVYSNLRCLSPQKVPHVPLGVSPEYWRWDLSQNPWQPLQLSIDLASIIG